MIHFAIQCTLVVVFLKHNFMLHAQFLNQKDTLKLVHVILRHGDRTPTTLYPNDIHTKMSFYPTGLGELTNVGKNRAYNIGIKLRRAYGSFLGDLVTPNILKAISSPVSRCTDSLLLVLASLFPPVDVQTWKYGLNWQPISYEYNNKDDKLFLVYKSCPNFKIFQDEHQSTKGYAEAIKPFKQFVSYARKKTGDYKEKYVFAYQTYTTLFSEMDYGLQLPTWATNFFIAIIKNVAKVEVEEMYKGKNKILGAGYLMAKVVNDTNLMLSNATEVEGRKLYLYSGHDMNIISILSWLGVFQPHLPPYGSYIAMEIHVVQDTSYIRILYENYDTNEPQPLHIPNCGIVCPFTEFLKIYKRELNPQPLCGL